MDDCEKPKQTVWVVSGRTESGDDWALVFGTEPTKQMIEAAIQEDTWLRDEWREDCIQGWTIVCYPVLCIPNGQTVLLSLKEYESLIDDQKWRSCLEGGGVDNWPYYHDSLREGGYFEEDEE